MDYITQLTNWFKEKLNLHNDKKSENNIFKQ